MKYRLAVLMVCVSVAAASASGPGPVDIPTRARGAQRVVVGTVADVLARFDTNKWGDQLLVSDLLLEVEETLKGPPASVLRVTVEGGTLGDITLEVSDMPSVKKGQRAVLFLEEQAGGSHVLHRRGQGLIPLDAGNRVPGTTLTLAQIGQLVRQGR